MQVKIFKIFLIVSLIFALSALTSSLISIYPLHLAHAAVTPKKTTLRNTAAPQPSPTTPGKSGKLSAVSPTASDGVPTIGQFSQLPLPRFAQLKARKINARLGPNQNYAVKYLYQCPGCPVRIIEEYENWRKISDFAGREGWVLKNLLGPAGNVLIISERPIHDAKLREEIALLRRRLKLPPSYTPLLRLPDANARPLVKVETMTVASLIHCRKLWCEVRLPNFSRMTRMWVPRDLLWGV